MTLDQRNAATNSTNEMHGEYVSVQVGFWRSLWLVLHGSRIRRWEWWDRVWVEALLDEDDYAVMAMEDE